jgi:hypothetical protein
LTFFRAGRGSAWVRTLARPLDCAAVQPNTTARAARQRCLLSRDWRASRCVHHRKHPTVLRARVSLMSLWIV